MNKLPYAAPLAAAITLLLTACSPGEPPAEIHRPVRAVEVRYEASATTHRYFGSVQSRYESEHSFRVGGKITERRVDVGQRVRAGDVLGVLDDTDYRLAEEAAKRQLDAATVVTGQAESDWNRLQALKADGSVSESDEERARSAFDTARAAAAAEARRLEMARNQVGYTVLRASRDGVVTAVRFEVGQVLGVGQPALAIADESQPEVVVDVPEDHVEGFRTARFRASLASSPGTMFDMELRELSAQASPQTRTYRARLVAGKGARLPLGASATLVAQGAATGAPSAAVPAAALTQLQGKPAVWVARPVDGNPALARVELLPVQVRGYRNDRVLLSGPDEGTVVVAAGVQKMSPDLVVALPVVSPAVAQAERSAQ